MLENNNSNVRSESNSTPNVEFVLDDEKENCGLMFEDSDEHEAQTHSTSKLNFETAPSDESKDAAFASAKNDDITPKETVITAGASLNKVPYVPRFTEASENYRMADIPKQSRVVLEKSTNSNVIEPMAINQKIDPTAEIYSEEVSNAVSVNVGKPKSENFESSSKVFKFVKNELPREHVAEPSSDAIPVEEEEVQEILVEKKKVDPAEYRIPDPVETTAVSDYIPSSVIPSSRVLEDAPQGLGDSITVKNGKNKEYTAYLQRDLYKDRFIDKKMSICVRLFACVLLLIMLVASETMFAMGINIPEKMNLSDIPGAMAILDLQVILCLYLLAIPETIRAFKMLLKKRITTDLFLTVQLIVLSAYTVFMVIHSPRQYLLFGLVFAISTLGTILASFYKENADMKSFLLTSENGDKTVIDIRPTRTLERENVALDGAVREHKSKTARTFKTTFVSNFFGHSEPNAEKNARMLIMLSLVFGIAIVLGTVVFFVPGGAVSAVSAFSLVIMLACPVVSILAHKMVFFHAESLANSEGSAIIGERTLLDYSGVDVITFEDTEVFGDEDVSLQRIMLYGNSDNLSKALHQMSALFMNVGGPLNFMFSDALDRKCAPAQFVAVEDGGISGELDGHKILAGTLDYMIGKGATVPRSENGTGESNKDSTKVMYAAEDGVVYAKFYIRYSFSEEFSMLLPILEDYGIVPLVYTRDPNITRDLIITLTAGNDKIRVMKKNDTEQSENVIYRKVSCGMVTTAGKNEAVNTILISKKYSALMSRFAKLEFLALAVGAVFASIVAFGEIFKLPSLIPALWHTSLCAFMYIFSRITFRSQGK